MTKPCTICGSTYHTKTFCFKAPRTPIKQKIYIIPSRAKKSVKSPVNSLKPTKPNRKELVKAADTIFSKYIRKSYSINGLVRCVTCNRKDHWKEMHCGHFIPRGVFMTRWSELNCFPQCPTCNVELKGNLKNYYSFLRVKIGNDELARLKQASKQPALFSKQDLQDIIDKYAEKFKDL